MSGKTEWVTRQSALCAIEHAGAYIGLIRKRRAIAMLAAAPQPPAEAQAQGGGEVVEPMTGDLLPCPFCGSDSADTGGMLPWVECTYCDASGPSCGTEEEAVAAWNRRTPPPSAPVGVEASLRNARDYISRNGFGHDAAERIDEIDAALAQQPAAIPRLANCGRYTATDNTGQHYYLNHANTWQTFQGQHPAAVDGAMVERAFNAWCDVADVDEWRVRNAPEALRAALTAALATQPGGAE